jgi:tetratricopeptide (TPR) repeat protein
MRFISGRRLRYLFAQNRLLSLLLYEPWFAVAIACFLLLLIFPAFFLPKIWITSPKGFVPIVKVSGLDLAQAWSLKRSALKATEAGQFDHAYYAWQAAIIHNPADPELSRGALRTFLKDERKSEQGRDALRQALWLLKLTGTNLVDLELASKVFVRQGHLDLLLSLLEPRKDQLTCALRSCYLKSLFDRGRITAFRAFWKHDSSDASADPELLLYHSAYLAGWGPGETRMPARRELESALETPALRVLAGRLQLAVYAHVKDADRYRDALRRLEEFQADTLLYRIGYWRLLLLSGRKTEAVQLAAACPDSPATILEAIPLAELYIDLGWRDRALNLLKGLASSLGNEPNFWIFYAIKLSEAKCWEELRRVALQIRAHDTAGNRLRAYSYFLEGRAEFALRRRFFADTAFQKLEEWDVGDPNLGLHIAAQLAELGYAALARDLLQKMEKDFCEDAKYWTLLFKTADDLKQVDLMFSASKRAFQLLPQDPVAINNYAATLIISRQNQEELIELTLRLFSENPRSPVAAVNHGAALLLNQRPRDAEGLLREVNTSKLTRSQTAHYHLDLFELHVGLQQYDRAWAIGNLIDATHLYPTQRRWLEQTRRELATRAREG